jgi:hypothetical protein
MWDQEVDGVGRNSKDLPCNTHAYFARDVGGRLDMTVCNRSNDLVWGALGANAVHFSFLLEYMAAKIGCPVGKYYQFTNNLHGYLSTIEPLKALAGSTGLASRYEIENLNHVNIFTKSEEDEFEVDLFKLGSGNYSTSFFTGVVAPIEAAWKIYKAGGPSAAIETCSQIKADDWRLAATEWMLRCAARRKAKSQDDGVNYEN